MKAGDIIELTENQKEEIKLLSKQVDCAYVAFHTASANILSAEEELWETVHEMCPETKNYTCSVTRDQKILITKTIQKK